MKRENDKKKENEIKKEFLRSYRLHANRMERILEEIEELREMQMLPMQNMDGMPHAGAAGGLENYAALFDEKDKELEKEKEQKMQAYSRIIYLSLIHICKGIALRRFSCFSLLHGLKSTQGNPLALSE